MKKLIFLISFVFVSFISEAQVKKPVDTTQMCIPYDVAQKMLLELNDYDRLKELSKLDKKEIVELNNKVELLNKVVQTWVEKDSLSREIISETEEKVKIYKEENEQLRDDNKRLKTKNTIFNIISGAIVAPLTYIALFK
jgi:hypothetical protein